MSTVPQLVLIDSPHQPAVPVTFGLPIPIPAVSTSVLPPHLETATGMVIFGASTGITEPAAVKVLNIVGDWVHVQSRDILNNSITIWVHVHSVFWVIP